MLKQTSDTAYPAAAVFNPRPALPRGDACNEGELREGEESFNPRPWATGDAAEQVRLRIGLCCFNYAPTLPRGDARHAFTPDRCGCCFNPMPLRCHGAMLRSGAQHRHVLEFQSRPALLSRGDANRHPLKPARLCKLSLIHAPALPLRAMPLPLLRFGAPTVTFESTPRVATGRCA